MAHCSCYSTQYISNKTKLLQYCSSSELCLGTVSRAGKGSQGSTEAVIGKAVWRVRCCRIVRASLHGNTALCLSLLNTSGIAQLLSPRRLLARVRSDVRSFLFRLFTCSLFVTGVNWAIFTEFLSGRRPSWCFYREALILSLKQKVSCGLYWLWHLDKSQLHNYFSFPTAAYMWDTNLYWKVLNNSVVTVASHFVLVGER